MFSDLDYGHVERWSHEEGDRVAYIAVRTRSDDAMNSSFDCSFRGGLECVSDVDYKTVRDRTGTYPFTGRRKNFETFLVAKLIEECEPAGAILMSSYTLIAFLSARW